MQRSVHCDSARRPTAAHSRPVPSRSRGPGQGDTVPLSSRRHRVTCHLVRRINSKDQLRGSTTSMPRSSKSVRLRVTMAKRVGLGGRRSDCRETTPGRGRGVIAIPACDLDIDGQDGMLVSSRNSSRIPQRPPTSGMRGGWKSTTSTPAGRGARRARPRRPIAVGNRRRREERGMDCHDR